MFVRRFSIIMSNSNSGNKLNWTTLAGLISAIAALITAISLFHDPEPEPPVTPAPTNYDSPPINYTPEPAFDPPTTNYDPDFYDIPLDTYVPNTLYCCDDWGYRRCPMIDDTPLGAPCICPYQGAGFVCE